MSVPAEKPTRKSVRDQQQAAYDVLHPKFLEQAESLMGREEGISRLCDCGRRVTVMVPELRGFLDLWKFYDERVAGKPAAQADAPRAVDVSRPVGEMSDEELLLLVGAAGSVA